MNRPLLSSNDIKTAILLFGGSISIYRTSLNEFNEPLDETLITKVTGYFYKTNPYKSFSPTDSGEKVSTNTKQEAKLLTWYSEESALIKKNDILEYQCIKYRITSLGNFENIYFDMSLQEVFEDGHDTI